MYIIDLDGQDQPQRNKQELDVEGSFSSYSLQDFNRD
jgi:hypothetical protein